MKRKMLTALVGMLMLFLCIGFNAQMATAATPQKNGGEPPKQVEQAPNKKEPAKPKKNIIDTVTVRVSGSEKNGMRMPTSVSVKATGAATSKSFSWNTAQSQWKPGGTYTGTIELTCNSGYEFSSNLNVSKSGDMSNDVTVSVKRLSSTKIRVTVTCKVQDIRTPVEGTVKFKTFTGDRLTWKGSNDNASFTVSIKMVDGTVLYSFSTNQNYLDMDKLPKFDNHQNLYFEVQEVGKEDCSRLYWLELDM